MGIWEKKFQAPRRSAGASGKERFLIHSRNSRRLVWLGQGGAWQEPAERVMGQVMNLEPTLDAFLSPATVSPPPAAEEEAHRQRHRDHHLPGARAPPFTLKNIRSHFSMSSSLSGPTTPALTTSTGTRLALSCMRRSQESWLPAAGEHGGGGERARLAQAGSRPRFLSVLQ